MEGSSYQRARLKERLFDAGLKERACELCGQGEIWHGRRMSLILDHVNGIADDNRLENLRVVCANCNATLDTHCGKQEPPARGRARVPALRRHVLAPARAQPLLLARVRAARPPRPRSPPGDRAASSARPTTSSSARSRSSVISASDAATA